MKSHICAFYLHIALLWLSMFQQAVIMSYVHTCHSCKGSCVVECCPISYLVHRMYGWNYIANVPHISTSTALNNVKVITCNCLSFSIYIIISTVIIFFLVFSVNVGYFILFYFILFYLFGGDMPHLI